MERRNNARRPIRIAAAATALLAANLPATSQEAVRPLPLRVQGSVKRSVALALQTLENDRCQALYSDFEDNEGHTLRENLELLGLTATQHLKALRWVDGTGHSLCRNPSIFFVAHVGDAFVRVCPKQFAAFAIRQPTKAAGIIVHEQLHTLGLGENPPSSESISRQVFYRCRL